MLRFIRLACRTLVRKFWADVTLEMQMLAAEHRTLVSSSSSLFYFTCANLFTDTNGLCMRENVELIWLIDLLCPPVDSSPS